MPHRSIYFLGHSNRRLFHSSAILKSTHYDILQIPTSASPKDIKTAFYHHSKLSHPDRNPSDPSSHSRFVRISEAYAVLRSPDKRLRYDREIGLHRTVPSGAPAQSHYGPAGGRAASGLSRRRGTFKGPPPSFYRNGGWGEHSAKRRTAQEGGATAAGAGSGTGTGTGAGTEGGMGWGQTSWGWSGEDVRHFDRESHLRTHSKHESRMKGRVKGVEKEEDGSAPTGALRDFLIVGGLILAGIIGVPRLWSRRRESKEGSKA